MPRSRIADHILVLLLSLSSCGKSNKVNLSFEKNELSVTVGETVNVTPSIEVGKKVKDFSVTYSVSDSTVASVDENGVLTALKEGKVTVSVIGNDKKNTKASIIVNVIAPTSFTVTFDTLGGTSVDAVVVASGAIVTKPTDPVKEGYAFSGWKLDNKTYDFSTPVTSNITLVASWKALKYYKVTFDYNDGETANCIQSVLEGTSAAKPTDPVRENYNFLGWYTIYGEYDFESTVKKEVYLTAMWEYTGPTLYTLTYNLNGGTMTEEVKEYTEVSDIALPTPTKEGYIFLGWYEDSIYRGNAMHNIVPGTTGNKELYARWVEKASSTNFKIAYDLGGGVMSNTQSRQTIVQLFIVDFKEYFKNTTYSSKTDNIASDGSTFFSYSYAKDGKALGYMFLTSEQYKAKWGWILTEINDARRALGKTALTAGDSQSESRGEIQAWINGTDGYVMSDGSKWGSNYESNEPHNDWQAYRSASIVLQDMYSKGTIGSCFATLMPDVQKEGYTLAGWYLTPNFEASSQVTTSTRLTESALVYAKWVAISYNINYELNDGINPSDVLDTYSPDDIVTFKSPSKEGWDFAGWYTTPTFDAGTKIVDTEGLTGDITIYAMWEKHLANVEFDFDGGVDQKLYDLQGDASTKLYINNYNSKTGGFASTESKCIFINDGEFIYGNPVNSYRIYIAKDPVTSLYKVIGVNLSGKDFPIPSKTEITIVISKNYFGEYTSNFDYNVKVGTVVSFKGNFKEASLDNPVEVVFNKDVIENDTLLQDIKTSSTIIIPTRVGYDFLGWYDDLGNRYVTVNDFTQDIKVTAKWSFTDMIVGSFETESWVVVGEEIHLEASYPSNAIAEIVWSVNDASIATVAGGVVRGVKEGVVEVYATDPMHPETKFTFYVTVFDEEPTGILKLLTDSNNASVYTKDDLIIGGLNGSPKEYYTRVTESVSRLLFEDYVVHNDKKMTNVTSDKAYGTFESIGQTVEFITFHYAADMNGKSATAGSDLASYGANPVNQVSFHFGIGNDGVWSSLPEEYAGYHAGTGKSKTTWIASGVMVEETDPEFAKTSLESDGYFYINGRRTNQQNTTDGKVLSEMGFATKIVNGEYYMTNMRFDSTYQRICSSGGNYNTIGIESSVAIYSDLWLTWQYGAQLCASLLLKYNLPLTQLVGHNFWSGKWCPQPMLEYDLEIWYMFVEYVRQQMEYFKNYSDYALTFNSTSSYLKSNGRVASLPEYSKCVKYDVTYTKGGVTKTVTLSSIVPGTIA